MASDGLLDTGDNSSAGSCGLGILGGVDGSGGVAAAAPVGSSDKLPLLKRPRSLVPKALLLGSDACGSGAVAAVGLAASSSLHNLERE